MRALPEVEFSDEQAEVAERIQDILAARSRVVAGDIAKLLASRSDGELFGQTEFLIRDALLGLGAEAIDTALEERKLCSDCLR